MRIARSLALALDRDEHRDLRSVHKPDIIVATDVDFAILRGGRVLGSARWKDVTEMRAYKRDELTTDLLCIAVQVGERATWVFHEEAPGWEEFLEAAEGALPGLRPWRSWYAEVAIPAFARNELLLFKRGAPAV